MKGEVRDEGELNGRHANSGKGDCDRTSTSSAPAQIRIRCLSPQGCTIPSWLATATVGAGVGSEGELSRWRDAIWWKRAERQPSPPPSPATSDQQPAPSSGRKYEVTAQQTATEQGGRPGMRHSRQLQAGGQRVAHDMERLVVDSARAAAD